MESNDWTTHCWNYGASHLQPIDVDFGKFALDVLLLAAVLVRLPAQSGIAAASWIAHAHEPKLSKSRGQRFCNNVSGAALACRMLFVLQPQIWPGIFCLDCHYGFSAATVNGASERVDSPRNFSVSTRNFPASQVQASAFMKRFATRPPSNKPPSRCSVISIEKCGSRYHQGSYCRRLIASRPVDVWLQTQRSSYFEQQDAESFLACGARTRDLQLVGSTL